MMEFLWPFIAGFAAFAAIHSLLAMDKVKRFVFRISPFMKYQYRAAYNLIAIVTLGILLLFSPVPDTVLYRIGFPLNVVMYILMAVAAIGLLYTVLRFGAGSFSGFRQLKHAFSSNPPEYYLDEPKKETRLIVEGPFHYVRHPLYSFASVFLLLNPVMTINWMVFTILSIVYFIVGSKHEEYRLIRRFGDSYRNYRERIPAFIPWPSRNSDPEP